MSAIWDTLHSITNLSNSIYLTGLTIYLENIEKIPNNFQGSFERIDDKDTIRYKLFETFGLIDNDSLKLGSDKFIVKHQNKFQFYNGIHAYGI